LLSKITPYVADLFTIRIGEMKLRYPISD
jgi:hypothetical protein